MANLNEFTKRIKIIAEGIESNTNKTTRQVALVADRELVLATPVDTGRARSNWFVNLNSPATKQIDPYDPGENGSTAGTNAQAAIDQAKAVIATRKIGQDIYISNNLPYIERLNEGYSKQAPKQFVESAVQRATKVVKNTRVVK